MLQTDRTIVGKSNEGATMENELTHRVIDAVNADPDLFEALHEDPTGVVLSITGTSVTKEVADQIAKDVTFSIAGDVLNDALSVLDQTNQH
jgi:hypothetical protein